MTPTEATTSVLDGLNALQIPYMLVGSFSSNYYGIPRSTKDADFVVHLQPGMLSNLAARIGPPFRLDRQMSFETVTATRRYVMHLDDDPFSVEFFLLSDEAHDRERFSRRQQTRILDRDAYMPTVEDVIVTKLRWSHAGNRSKDMDDVRNVISVQGDRIDWAYVNSWCDRHGTRELLEQTRDSLALSEAQKTELDRRLEAFRQSPGGGSSWEEVKARIQVKK